MALPSSSVEVRILKPGPRLGEFLSLWKGLAVQEGQDVAYRSMLGARATVGEHLKWFYTMLLRDRRFLRQRQQEGIRMVCRISVASAMLEIEPEALLLLHKLHLTMELSLVRKRLGMPAS